MSGWNAFTGEGLIMTPKFKKYETDSGAGVKHCASLN